RTVNLVRAGAGYRVDYASCRAAELRRIGIGEDLKFQHCFHAEKNASDRARSLIVNIINIRAIEEETALLRPHSIDRDLGSSPAHGVVASYGHAVDSWLQKRQLLERAAVERQIAHLFLID